MNNREVAIAILAQHREARKWADEVVADDLLRQLGLDRTAKAEHATIQPPRGPDVVEDEVVAAEEASRIALENAMSLRAKLQAQEERAAEEQRITDEAAEARARAEREAEEAEAARNAPPEPEFSPTA